MKRMVLTMAAAAVFCAAFVCSSFAEEPIVYPAKGQSESKMAKDKGDCSSWAMKQTGVNPSAVAAEPVPEAEASGPKGARLKGGGRGAAGGAAVGAIMGDAGKGAAIGAVAGGLRAGREARQERKEEKEEAAHKAEAQKQQTLSTYDRAFCACMEGRGYTVK